MKPRILLALLLGLSSLNLTAHAEGGTCPNGYYPVNSPGMMSCAPIPGYNQQQAAPQPPQPQWESRWGAISTDASRGVVGATSGMPSRQAAEQAVIADCRAKGGTECKLQVSYANGCGAMVVGDKAFTVEWGTTQDDAAQKSLRMCSTATTNCRVYYSTCSPPARIH